MKLAIGSDHAGFGLKKAVKDFLTGQGHELVDLGAYSEESSDYPDYAHPLAKMILKKEADFGILMCGSGNGINMAVNKHRGIRAALCWKMELAELARKHNDANVITLPARFIEQDQAKKIVEVFLKTAFEGGRHHRRINKIDC